MDKEGHSPVNTTFTRHYRPDCLKPLSTYSRMITCEQEASFHHQISGPLINLKIEVENNGANKRKKDSICDDGYETPAKTAPAEKACSPKDLSPDLGCLMDYCSPPATQDLASPFAVSKPALLGETQASSSDVKESVRCDKVPLNLAAAFDCDVDDILCLVPVDNAEGCKSSNAFLAHVEPLEGDVDEEWHIGSPKLQSSMCQDPLGDEATLDTTYETTLPLQVQVKSVVVDPRQHTSTGQTAAPPLPDQTAKPAAPSPDKSRSQRAVILDRELDTYVHSVNCHIKERPGADQDVMTELLTLMTRVAEQTAGSDGRQWQHPSDLTRRNHQRRSGNGVPRMALREWQSRNGPTRKRFARVPSLFERSPVL